MIKYTSFYGDAASFGVGLQRWEYVAAGGEQGRSCGIACVHRERRIDWQIDTHVTEHHAPTVQRSRAEYGIAGCYTLSGEDSNYGRRWLLRTPMYWSLGLGATAALLLLRPQLIRAQRRRQGACLHCGYDLRLNQSGTCPECGATVPPFSPR